MNGSHGFPPGFPAGTPPGYPPSTPAQPPPAPVHFYRVCFSGSLVCSGCNPCDACLSVVREQVLPPAMIAGGFANDRVQSQRFFEAYIGAGWGRFRASLQQMIALQQIPTMDSRVLQAALELYAHHLQQLQQATEPLVAPPPATPEAPPLPAGPTVPGGSPTGHFTSTATVGALGSGPDAVSPNVRVGATPLTVEDVVILAEPVPAPLPAAPDAAASGPQALGNVLDVPPDEIAAHLNGARNANGSA